MDIEDYEIMEDGRVWSHHTRSYRKIQTNSQTGYKFVQLFIDGERENCYIHHLVMDEYGPPRPSSEHQIHHKDHNKANNHINNLEWVTHQENMDAYHREFRGESISKDDVCHISWLVSNTNFKRKAIADFYGVSPPSVQYYRDFEEMRPPNVDEIRRHHLEYSSGNRLSYLEAAKIRWLAQNTDYTQKQIGRRFNVSKHVVSQIKQEKTYTDAPRIDR